MDMIQTKTSFSSDMLPKAQLTVDNDTHQYGFSLHSRPCNVGHFGSNILHSSIQWTGTATWKNTNTFKYAQKVIPVVNCYWYNCSFNQLKKQWVKLLHHYLSSILDFMHKHLILMGEGISTHNYTKSFSLIGSTVFNFCILTVCNTICVGNCVQWAALSAINATNLNTLLLVLT